MRRLSKKIVAILLAVVMICAITAIPANAASTNPLPTNCVIGYWENWVNDETPNIKLSEVDPGWDVIIVSFLVCDSTSYTGLLTLTIRSTQVLTKMLILRPMLSFVRQEDRRC